MSEPTELFSLQQLGVESISLDYKLSRRRDRYGNTFRYRAKVGAVADSQVGPFAFDVFLSTVRTASTSARSNTPGAISGASNPEAIPIEVVYGFFLRGASCTDADPELFQRKCAMVAQAIGLTKVDESHVAPHLAGLRDELAALDSEVALARRSTDADANSRRLAVEGKRRNLILSKIESLKQQLTPEGQAASGSLH